MATTATATTTNPASNLFTSLNPTASTKTSSTTNESQSRFLTLLTTQLKNQDPLNPMDNAQMTSQLAQISTVDGIERLNATLSKLITGQTESQTLQAAALVGHGVLVAGSDMTLKSGAAAAGFELEKPADFVNIDIKDANGIVVRTLRQTAVDAGVNSFTWDGKNDGGGAVADGQYSFAISAKQGADDVKVTRLELGVVDSVSIDGMGTSVNIGKLNSKDLGKFSMAEIKQIL